MPDRERVAGVLRAATRTPQPVDTRKQQVIVKTNRGVNLTIGPRGRIDGLWRLYQRELRTNEQIRELAGGITRHTLLRWRRRDTDPFPPPVVTIPAHPPVELWSRTQAEDWLERNRS